VGPVEPFAKCPMIARRSKTRKHRGAPAVNYLLWKETFQLLCQERSTDGDRVLLNDNGGPLKIDKLCEGDDSQKKIDNVASAYSRLRRQTKIAKPLKVFRKTSSTLIRGNKNYATLADMFLGLAPTSIADRHYAGVPQAMLDEAILWLGEQYGIDKQPRGARLRLPQQSGLPTTRRWTLAAVVDGMTRDSRVLVNTFRRRHARSLTGHDVRVPAISSEPSSPDRRCCGESTVARTLPRASSPRSSR
jgi:hypothetical protein